MVKLLSNETCVDCVSHIQRTNKLSTILILEIETRISTGYSSGPEIKTAVFADL
jgi:hypothetical protein